VRLAYLCNLYPAVSHSFVRREIAGVEAQGHTVHRFSLRPPPPDLCDDADLAEASLTEAVLAKGSGQLVLASLALLATRPIRTVNALALALHLSGQGLGVRIRHAAYFLEAAWLTRRLEELRVEHLHVHFATNPAVVGMLVSSLGGPPFSLTIHGSEEFDSPVALRLGAKVEAATFVAAISSFTRSQLMRWSKPEDWKKIQVVRCGVDEAFLQSPMVPVHANSTEFVCVARLHPGKGLTLLMEACERLRSVGEQFSLTIVGDGEFRRELEEEISRRGLKDIVSLVGTRSSAEIRDYLIQARAFVLPSFAEGLPVVIMEALALGRPVIATYVGGIPELLDSEDGWMIPAGSEDALVEAMTAALHASIQELNAKGTNGRERVRRLHDSRKNAALIAEAIVSGGVLPDSMMR
jgi:colanic acid/amylovoran biosynthesis glycosyltransferase